MSSSSTNAVAKDSFAPDTATETSDAMTKATATPISNTVPSSSSSKEDSPSLPPSSSSSSSLTIPPTLDDDEVLAQATACALQAQEELAKIVKSKQQPFSFPDLNLKMNQFVTIGGIGAISGQHNNNNNNGTSESGGSNKPKLPLGDIQQRKLIEKKLGHSLDQHEHHNNNMSGNNNTSPQMISLNEVKEKIENFFPQKLQQQSHQQKENPTPKLRSNQSSPESKKEISSNAMNFFPKRAVSPSSSMEGGGGGGVNANVTSNNDMKAHIIEASTTTTTTFKTSSAPASSTLSTSTSKRSTLTPTNTMTTISTSTTPKPIGSVDGGGSKIINNGTIQKPTLSTNVWKRRNGYGKYSVNAWEKRRLELVGNKIMYYKNTGGSNGGGGGIDPDQQQQQQQQQQIQEGNLKSKSGGYNVHDKVITQSSANPQSTKAQSSIDEKSSLENITFSNTTTTKSQKKDIHQLWENAKQNINKTINELSIANTKFSSTDNNDDPDAPRGCIDLYKEHATVSAISDHDKSQTLSLTSVSPTPYGLSIVTKSESQKWKLCFDTHGEQIRWLTILTEIIVRKSVDLYNSEIVKNKNVVVDGNVGGSGGDSSVSNNVGIIGGIGSALNNNDVYLPSPMCKDGMWKIDERFSYRGLMVIGESLEEEDDEKDEKEEGGEEKEEQQLQNKEDDDSGNEGDEIFPCTSTSASSVTLIAAGSMPVKKKEQIREDEPLVSDLPLKIADIVQRGAKSGPEWFMKGHNLSFAYGFVNLSLFWVYISPMHWLFFPIYLCLVNIVLLIISTTTVERIVEIDGSLVLVESAKQISLRNFGESVRSFRQRIKPPTKQITSSNKKSGKKEAVSASKETKSKEIEAVKAVQKSFKKPIAGTSTKRLSHDNDTHFVNNRKFISWSILSSEEVQVRSHGYLKTKKKIPSPAALYEVTNVEVLTSDFRLAEIASKVVLPKTNADDDDEVPRRWNSPDYFVVSLAVPTEEPSFTRATEDGFGFNVVMYYSMKKETREILKRITSPGYDHVSDTSEDQINIQKRLVNGVRLWEEWCTRAPSDADWQARFKLIPNVLNPVEVGLPSWIGKYCGKPVLIKRKGKTGFLSTHPDVNAFEFDISLHVFPYLAKKAMAYLSGSVFSKALTSLSYVIEARADDELPEILIGDAVKIHYPDTESVISADDFFAGTSPKSIKSD